MTHIANSRRGRLVHAVDCMTMSRVYLGSNSSNNNNRNSRNNSSSKEDLHLPRGVRSKVGKAIRLPWGITSHILKISTTDRRTITHTASRNHLSNIPSSRLVPVPHRALRAPQESSLSRMAKAKVRACMASSTSRPTMNLSWAITPTRTATRTS